MNKSSRLHRRLLFVLCCILAIQPAYSQRTLNGIVYSREGGNPLGGIEIFVRNGDRAVSESNGMFSLNLGDESYFDPGSELVLYLEHPHLGFNKAIVTIPMNLRNGIELYFSPNRFKGITGTVRDSETRELLSGISVGLQLVGVSGNEIRIQPDTTDAFGSFFFKLDKQQVGEIESVRFLVKDHSKGCYLPVTPLETAGQGIVIEVTKSEECKGRTSTSSGNLASPGGTNSEFASICFQNKLQERMQAVIGTGDGDMILQASIQKVEIDPGGTECFEGLPPGRYKIGAERADRFSGFPNGHLNKVIVVAPGETKTILIQ